MSPITIQSFIRIHGFFFKQEALHEDEVFGGDHTACSVSSVTWDHGGSIKPKSG